MPPPRKTMNSKVQYRILVEAAGSKLVKAKLHLPFISTGSKPPDTTVPTSRLADVNDDKMKSAVRKALKRIGGRLQLQAEFPAVIYKTQPVTFPSFRLHLPNAVLETLTPHKIEVRLSLHESLTESARYHTHTEYKTHPIASYTLVHANLLSAPASNTGIVLEFPATPVQLPEPVPYSVSASVVTQGTSWVLQVYVNKREVLGLGRGVDIFGRYLPESETLSATVEEPPAFSTVAGPRKDRVAPSAPPAVADFADFSRMTAGGHSAAAAAWSAAPSGTGSGGGEEDSQDSEFEAEEDNAASAAMFAASSAVAGVGRSQASDSDLPPSYDSVC